MFFFFPQNLFAICIRDFQKCKEQVFEQKREHLIIDKILGRWHFCTKLNGVFFFSQQNIFAICIFDLKIFCVKFFNHQYFILHKILVLYGLSAFSSKIKTSFFFSYKISFLFVSGTSKYAMYNFLSRNYDTWFQTKFMARIAWWCFHPILNWGFFFPQNLIAILSRTFKYAMYKF